MPLIKTPWALTEKEKPTETFLHSYCALRERMVGMHYDDIFAEFEDGVDALCTYNQAKEEFAKHHCENDFPEFIQAYGDFSNCPNSKEYLARDVLIWLGY